MTKYILLLFTILLSVKSFSQNDSLQREILNYSDSKTEIISKGRAFLLEKFISRDLEKVREIKNYLLEEVENENYLAIYPIENWLLQYWTEEYTDLLSQVLGFGEPEMRQFQEKIKPAQDLLFEKLQENSRISLPTLQASIASSDLTEEQKDFLFLYLKYLLAASEDPQREQEKLNLLADRFLAAYPESEYEEVIRNNIRFVVEPSRWGLAFEFFTGYGAFTGELNNYYQNNIPVGIDFDVEYKDFTLYLRNYIGMSFTKREQPFEGGVWKEDAQARIYLLEASVGHALINNEKIKFSPFAGIASTSISATEYDLQNNPDLERVELGFTTTYTVGLNLDFKLNWGTGLLSAYETDHSYWFIRLRYGYTAPQFDKHYPDFGGNMHYFTVGIGGLYRGVKRQL